jgi:hypothetical protein
VNAQIAKDKSLQTSTCLPIAGEYLASTINDFKFKLQKRIESRIRELS